MMVERETTLEYEVSNPRLHTMNDRQDSAVNEIRQTAVLLLFEEGLEYRDKPTGE